MTAAAAKPWFVYLVRAENGALYCGISDDAQRRFEAHRSGKGDALRRERAIKALSKKAKERLVLANPFTISAVDVVPSEG